MNTWLKKDRREKKQGVVIIESFQVQYQYKYMRKKERPFKFDIGQ